MDTRRDRLIRVAVIRYIKRGLHIPGLLIDALLDEGVYFRELHATYSDMFVRGRYDE